MQPDLANRKGRQPARAHPQRDRAYARPAILVAARQLFKNEAYADISVERIAAAAQVTRHTLNNHFASKDEIFRLSREALIAEASKLMVDAIPSRMETQEGVVFFLENCFRVFSSNANLELMTSIIRDGRYHAWLEQAHHRQVRGRLMQCCETFLLYHIDRDKDLLEDARVIAEQLTAKAENMAYGPYFNCKGEAVCPPQMRARNFTVSAKAIAAMLDGRRPPVSIIPPQQHDQVQRIGGRTRS